VGGALSARLRESLRAGVRMWEGHVQVRCDDARDSVHFCTCDLTSGRENLVRALGVHTVPNSAHLWTRPSHP